MMDRGVSASTKAAFSAEATLMGLKLGVERAFFFGWVGDIERARFPVGMSRGSGGRRTRSIIHLSETW